MDLNLKHKPQQMKKRRKIKIKRPIKETTCTKGVCTQRTTDRKEKNA